MFVQPTHFDYTSVPVGRSPPAAHHTYRLARSASNEKEPDDHYASNATHRDPARRAALAPVGLRQLDHPGIYRRDPPALAYRRADSAVACPAYACPIAHRPTHTGEQHAGRRRGCEWPGARGGTREAGRWAGRAHSPTRGAVRRATDHA